MIVIFLLLCIAYGYSIIKCIGPEKINGRRIWENIEIITIILPCGFLGLTVNMFLIDLLGIALTRNSIWSFLVLQIVVINTICKREYYITTNLHLRKFEILDILLAILILNFITCAIVNYPYLPDEYSHWALQTKNIFKSNKIDIFMNTGFESYPGYIPLLGSAYYFLVDNVEDNSIRVISTIHLIIILTNMIYISEKSGWGNKIVKILSIIVLTSMPVIKEISSSLYADIIFMCYYASAIQYFILWYRDKQQGYYRISIIYMIGATWIKTDGIYLCIGQVVIMLVLYIKNRDIKIKSILKYALYSLALIMIWKIYCIAYKFPSSRWELTANISYIIPMCKAMIDQTFSFDSGGYINILTMICIIISYKYLLDDEMIIIILVLIGNIMFLGISYILFFGGEALTAASYSRYMTRTIPVQILLITKVLNRLKYKGGDNSEKTCDYSCI